MTYYSSWQDALVDFVNAYGQNYKEVGEVYALMAEFEQQLFQNIKGSFYILKENK